MNCEGETMGALLPSAGVLLTDPVVSQFIKWPLDVTSFCELEGIEIEVSIHSLEIMAWGAGWDAAAHAVRLDRACKLRVQRWQRQCDGSWR